MVGYIICLDTVTVDVLMVSLVGVTSVALVLEAVPVLEVKEVSVVVDTGVAEVVTEVLSLIVETIVVVMFGNEVLVLEKTVVAAAAYKMTL